MLLCATTLRMFLKCPRSAAFLSGANLIACTENGFDILLFCLAKLLNRECLTTEQPGRAPTAPPCLEESLVAPPGRSQV